VEAGVQPGLQTGLGRREVDSGNAYLGQSELMRPSLQLPDQLLPVHLLRMTHVPILGTHRFRWADESACEAFARNLAQRAALHDAYLELHGPLGAGKTTFVRHLLRALGVQGRIKSPTYAVVETYALPGLEIAHFDFYRFEDPREWEDAGFRDVFAAPGLKLAEWPEKAAAVLPTPDLSLHLEPVDDHVRDVLVQAHTGRGVALMA
jgi:tRNA threonylcarbamoyladenosine biosynthesis protein TsaE